VKATTGIRIKPDPVPLNSCSRLGRNKLAWFVITQRKIKKDLLRIFSNQTNRLHSVRANVNDAGVNVNCLTSTEDLQPADQPTVAHCCGACLRSKSLARGWSVSFIEKVRHKRTVREYQNIALQDSMQVTNDTTKQRLVSGMLRLPRIKFKMKYFNRTTDAHLTVFASAAT